MSKFIRIIPKLDIKGNSLVKGINLEGLRVLGSPIDFAKYYFLNNADEIIYQDVVASLYSRDNFLHLIQDTAKEIFIPLTVGGGIRSLKDIYQILRAGADKVSINTAAINKPQFLYEAIHKYGDSLGNLFWGLIKLFFKYGVPTIIIIVLIVYLMDL